MAWIKRIFLFVAVNLLVIVTISIVLNVLGVKPYITARGIDYRMLMAFCLVWGMGGAFISLALSKVMAKWMAGVRVIEPDTREPVLRDLVQMVHSLARRAGMTKMPEVGVYDSPEINAFATGPTKNSSIVAVSTGLLQRMDRSQLEGVLGHEISHINNGDMVTMTLIQGVVNAFVMFFARVISWAVCQNVKENARYLVHFLVTMVLEIVFSLLGFIVVAYFSRHREYRADAGGARVAGRDKMIDALKALMGSERMVDKGNEALATLKISGRPSGFMALFATHPALEDRIRRLESARI
ncbi:MAG: zinc metalloprotease HtpX [Candidatus Lindowbacteria bacterium RIFCSPLOWO2_12_FULL_62_27]|nr:MAG: zinc metalloprotease HtpX [Candidatus Lindowbacteria bacterium RIFCSPLOWO2_12_FULL_62_27]OGH61572.1 MAG: zinc metalloprotease HtpX [Candidatus Lindowbacteria bacterium RIFCSPLOWO2_02_FULL_62_12]